MNINKIVCNLLLYYCIFVQLYSLFRIFGSLVGRTSTKVKREESHEEKSSFSTDFENISRSYSPDFEYPSKLYMIVIDALRPDFINENDTPFMWSSLQSNNRELTARAFTVKVHSPTVTMPRIKSLLTGSIPSYQDFITNFHSTRLEDDNLIWRFKENGKNVCFYGDDTWLKLFNGEEYFTRSEGVHSFFVTDWIEVDENVTRNVHHELLHKLQPEPECQVTILHYLGLDHIGHVHGPRSPLINEKMREMDNVIKEIYTFASKNSLLFICGDHGMANIGGHGGDSWEETHTVLLAIAKVEEKAKTFYSSATDQAIVYQTDIAPTLAILFGLDIPETSVGTLIPDILSVYLKQEHVLQSFHNNFLHLNSIMKKMGHIHESDEYFTQLNKSIHLTSTGKFSQDLIMKYIKINQELSLKLGNELAGERDLKQMILFVVILAEVVLIMITFEESSSSWNVMESTIAYKYQVLAIITLLLSYVFISVDFTLFILNILILYQLRGFRWDLIFKSKTDFFPAVTIYFASSLIEEEHYVRYFLWTSIIFYRFIISSNSDQQASKDSSQIVNVVALLLIHRLTSILNQTGQKWIETRDLNDVINNYKCVELTSFVSICLLIWFTKKSSMLFKLTVCYIYILKLFLFWNENVNSTLISGVQLAYILIGGSVFWEYFTSQNHFVLFNITVLFSLLLHKLINYTILVSVVLQLKLLYAIVEPYFKKQNSTSTIPSYIMSLFTWYAFACFFYQGNSNNITTIEVNIGYTGLESYNSLIIGSLIFFYTCSTPFLVYSFLVSNDFCTPSIKSQIAGKIVKVNGIECLVYSIVIIMFRNHLFIWSVFVPKLFYLAGWTVFHIIVITLCIFK